MHLIYKHNYPCALHCFQYTGYTQASIKKNTELTTPPDCEQPDHTTHHSVKALDSLLMESKLLPALRHHLIGINADIAQPKESQCTDISLNQ